MAVFTRQVEAEEHVRSLSDTGNVRQDLRLVPHAVAADLLTLLRRGGSHSVTEWKRIVASMGMDSPTPEIIACQVGLGSAVKLAFRTWFWCGIHRVLHRVT